MAIKIYEQFAPFANPADTDYPHGSIKNDSIPGAEDGTPLDAVWGNDIVGFTDALLADAGIEPNGQPDTVGDSQRVHAIKQLEKAASKVTKNGGGSVQDFIDAQYTTIAELATGKFKDGQYVRLTDRAMGLFLVKSGGTVDGYRVLDAGFGLTAELVIVDGKINVKFFGAVGNWDMGTQTGADDTLVFQACLDYLGTLGSRRDGAVRKLTIPPGNYKISKLKIPVGIKFGLDIIGEGVNSTLLWFDNTTSTDNIDCEIELLSFKNITFMGALSDSVAGSVSEWRDIGFKFKNFYNIPDIDVTFKDCNFFFFKDITNVYGRGVTFDNCSIGGINCLLNIVCDPTTTFVPGDALLSVETGMRNYDIRNNRTDQVREVLVKVTGTGAQKEYINGLSIRNNSFVGTVLLVDAPDATLHRLSACDNTGLYSFRSGFISAKGVTSSGIFDNNLSRRFEETIDPTGFNDAIPFIINTTSELRSISVCGNTVRNLSASPVATAGVASDITIKNNMFPNGWTYFESAGNLCHIFLSFYNCPGLTIEGNQFSSTVTSKVYRVFNPAVQTDKNTFIGSNKAPWRWVDARLAYTPSLLVNGVATSVAPSSRSGRYHYDGKYVHAEVMIIVAMTEVTGALTINLPPVSAIAEDQGITSFYGGGGEVINHSGFSVAGSVFSRILVNPTTQRAELWKESGMIRTAVTAADKSGTVVLYTSFKYRA